MSEHSKEYIEKQDWNIPADFSIVEVFHGLDEDEISHQICEGFGFVGILKEDGICKLVFRNPGKIVTLAELLGKVMN